jgi:hypothetical protein
MNHVSREVAEITVRHLLYDINHHVDMSPDMVLVCLGNSIPSKPRTDKGTQRVQKNLAKILIGHLIYRLDESRIVQFLFPNKLTHLLLQSPDFFSHLLHLFFKKCNVWIVMR